MRAWYRERKTWWLSFFIPLEQIYKIWVLLHSYRLFKRAAIHIPIVVVGNITVGGSGKTPAVIALARILVKKGLRVGLISRGYKGIRTGEGMQVLPQSDFVLCGDEAVLLARRTHCPICICKHRNKAVRMLLAEHSVDVVISDDGLQHHALPRQVEIAVLDARIGFGNKHCLPVGPLREPLARLKQVDFLLVNRMNVDSKRPRHGYKGEEVAAAYQGTMSLRKMWITDIHNGEKMSWARWKRKYAQGPVHAVAGIAQPDNFFALLKRQEVDIIPHIFPDHHHFRRRELSFATAAPIIMTEKDAVRCEAYKDLNIWVLRLETSINDTMIRLLLSKLNAD